MSEEVLVAARRARTKVREAEKALRDEQLARDRAVTEELVAHARASLAKIMGEDLASRVDLRRGVPGVYAQLAPYKSIGGVQGAGETWAWYVDRKPERLDLRFESLEELGEIMERFWARGNEYDYEIIYGYRTPEEQKMSR